MTLEAFKGEIGYTVAWDLFVPESFFLTQLAEYLACQAAGELIHKEHYRWASYRYILGHHDVAAPEHWDRFVDLIEADPDPHLFKGAISALLEARVLRREHFLPRRSPKLLSFSKVRLFLGLND